jgi:hypothetical protein
MARKIPGFVAGLGLGLLVAASAGAQAPTAQPSPAPSAEQTAKDQAECKAAATRRAVSTWLPLLRHEQNGMPAGA